MRLFRRLQGQGRAVVVLHGLFGSSTNWETVARDLAQDFHVCTVDLRNHGRSAHADSMTYAEMAQDVLELIEEERLLSPAVIGHSMGGKVAMMLALSHPSIVSALVAVDIAPVTYPPKFGSLLNLLCEVPLDKFSSRAQADAFLAMSIADTRLRAFLLQNLMHENGHFRWRLNLSAIMANLAGIFGFPTVSPESQYQSPTLFIRGQWSNFVRDEDLPSVRVLFPESQVVTVGAAGHWVHADQPGTFLSELRTFLES